MGSWAKEQITIENISSNPDIEIFSYIRNPGIISQVKGYQIGSLYDISGIVNFALEKKIDLVIITTAPPLSIGLVDALEENHILAFGPVRLAARLEAVDLDERSLRKIVGLRYYYRLWSGWHR